MSVFLRGTITADRLPLIDNFYIVGVEHDTPVQMILDTGFSGMVCCRARCRQRANSLRLVTLPLN
jgi:hypothetical protein